MTFLLAVLKLDEYVAAYASSAGDLKGRCFAVAKAQRWWPGNDIAEHLACGVVRAVIESGAIARARAPIRGLATTTVAPIAGALTAAAAAVAVASRLSTTLAPNGPLGTESELTTGRAGAVLLDVTFQRCFRGAGSRAKHDGQQGQGHHRPSKE